MEHIYEKEVYAPVRVVMAYCPFSELSNRLQKRNHEAEQPSGDPLNYRDPLMPIENFEILPRHNDYYDHSFDTKKYSDQRGMEEIAQVIH